MWVRVVNSGPLRRPCTDPKLAVESISEVPGKPQKLLKSSHIREFGEYTVGRGGRQPPKASLLGGESAVKISV